MNYPSIKEYKEAILFAEDNFEQLKNLRPVLDEEGNPVMTGGNFAEVFKMKDEQTGKIYAVKCFLREQEGRAEAYRQIAEELEYVSSTFLTPIKYLDKELFVDTNAGGDTEFPILLMDWVEGDTLDKYIRKHLDDQYELSLLAYQFSRLAMWLMPQPFAHGDLKPDNILVKGDGTLVLVDYDGMYVPAMKGQRARELGSPDFRHPSRTETDFDEHIDDFSLASILLSLKAIALQPSLLEEYGAQDRLLFSEMDYRNLSESKVIDALKPLIQDAELATLYSLFILSSAQNNLSQASFRLLSLSRPQPRSNERLSINGNETSSANTWVGEYVDLGLSIKWATCNIGANKPEEFGDYFKWGYYVPKNKPSLDKSKKSNLSYNSKYNVSDRIKVLNPEDDTATVLLGSPWRMPTIEEFKELKEKCVWKECYLNGVKGCRVTGINGNSIFLPFAGCYEVGFPFNADNGTYWSSSAYTDNYLTFDNSWLITFKSEHPIINYYFRSCATPIRPVILADENLSTKVTDDDLANTWTDEYGVIYSADKKRLLRAPGNIKSYSILVGTKIICSKAFKGCKKLTSISIPEGVSLIGDSAFYGCNNMRSIAMPNSVVSIGKLAFMECSGILSLTLSEKLKNIGERAFYTCVGLTSLLIPSKIEEIGDSAFQGCINLNKIIVDSNNKNYDSRNNCNAIIDSRNNTLIFGCSSTIIPETVTIIGDESFFLCKNLKTISIPDGVKEIGFAAFPGCDSLISIVIPQSVEKIGNAAFLACSSLSKVEIRGSVGEIPYRLFYNCSKLREVSILQPISNIGDEAFCGCSSITSIFIPLGTLMKFEELLPEYKDKFVEQEMGWMVKSTRLFDPEEQALVDRAEVVASQYGNSVCFFMRGGGQTYIPLSKQSKLTVGDELDIRTAKILTLSKKGKDDITRIIE